MYEQVEKTKENKSRVASNSVTQKKSIVKQGFGVVDNRSENVVQRKLQEVAEICSGENSIVQLQKNNNTSLGVIQRQISDGDYNSARDKLVNAGSDTARNSHVKHNTRGGSPDGHGISLLRETRDEFRTKDVGQTELVSGMTKAHHDAILAAANCMGIRIW